jgi:hypothetical protein
MLFGFSILFVLMCLNVYVYIVYDLQFMITFEFNDVYTCALPRGLNDVPMIFRHIHPSIVHTRLRAVPRSLLLYTTDPKMDLHPHLHLLVPSVTAGVDLEVRLYMSRELLNKIPKSWTTISGLSSSASSNPVPATLIDHDTLSVLKSIDRLVIASHPWGRFGGNMLFPYVTS